MTDIERIARLEVTVARQETDIAKLAERLERLTEELGKNNRLLTRAGGMVAGAALLVSILWTVAITAWQFASGNPK